MYMRNNDAVRMGGGALGRKSIKEEAKTADWET